MKPNRALVGVLPLSNIVTASQPGPASGLEIIHINHVSCSRPTQSGDMVAVHYRGTLKSDGTLFDESYTRGEPLTFMLGKHKVITGWDQGLLGMCPGEKRKLVIPPELAYGDRPVGPIPPHSTLIFDTELVEILGVKQEMLSTASTLPSTTAASAATEMVFSIATAPSEPISSGKTQEQPQGAEHEDSNALIASPLPETQNKDKGKDPTDDKKAECRLLGPFALLVQGALGAVALLSLVWKRYRETPKRPWKIFFFDVSKQVFGSMLTHVLNLAMSMLGSGEIFNAVRKTAEGQAQKQSQNMPNPCSFYLLNLAIDTTLGIPVLYLLLKILHALALYTPLAKPPQSIKSGSYDHPPRTTWWLKQLLIYFLGLVGMKLFVLFLFKAMPWLPWVGDWALRWTRGHEALEVTFVMFIFPLIMNGVQYWIIDSLIKDNGKGGGDYQQVQVDEDEGDGEHFERHMPDDDDLTELSADDTIAVEADHLKEAHQAPLMSHVPGDKGQGPSPKTRSIVSENR